MAVSLRVLSDPGTPYKASDLTKIFVDDFNLIGKAISTAEDGINTADVAVAGEVRIDSAGAGIFRECRPDTTAARKLGTPTYEWDEVHAQTYYGSGGSLTGILKNPLTSDLVCGTNKVTDMGAPSVATDAATKGYVDGLVGSSGTTTTTDATPTVCHSLTLDDNTAYLVVARVVARRTDAAGRSGYVRRAVVYREAAGSATILGTVDTPFSRDSTPQYDATITVSGNDAQVTVTGFSGHTIDWTCRITTEEAV